MVKDTNFVGNYEKCGSLIGTYEEQWLWKNRGYISGKVLDMSTPRYFHEFVYDIADKVSISNLSDTNVEKMGHSSAADIVHDFCLPYDGRFNTILCMSILEHCINPFSMIKNLSKSIEPGGYLFVWTPFAYTDGHMEEDYWRFCKRGYYLLLEEAGMTVVSYDRFLDVDMKKVLGFDAKGVYVCHGVIGQK